MNRLRTAYLVLIATVLTFGIIGVGMAAKADAAPRTEFMPCATDEGPDAQRNCVWDARHQGNGLGHSFFISKSGKVTRLPHSIAHYLIHPH